MARRRPQIPPSFRGGLISAYTRLRARPGMTAEEICYTSAMNDDPRSDGWALDPLLQRDTTPVGDLPLCRVLLINDANYPWVLLVPRRPDTVEIIDLEYIEQAQLMTEVSHASRTLQAMTRCDKINVAALGNVVPRR